MTNRLYNKGAYLTMTAQVDWSADDIRAIVVSDSYVVDLVNHDFLDDVSAYALCTAVPMTGLTVLSSGNFDADDIAPTMSAGTGRAIILYLHNADPTMAPLLAYINNILGFPVTTAGGPLPIQWPNNSKRILSPTGG